MKPTHLDVSYHFDINFPYLLIVYQQDALVYIDSHDVHPYCLEIIPSNKLDALLELGITPAKLQFHSGNHR